MSEYGNYPMGTDGSDPRFDWPDPPECPNRDCMVTLEPDWSFCPGCGRRIDWGSWDAEGGEWRCS